QTADAIERLDPSALGPESACGRVPVCGLLSAARRRRMSIARLDLRNSGDTAGPRGQVVGYGSWALFESAGQEFADRLPCNEGALAAVGAPQSGSISTTFLALAASISAVTSPTRCGRA